MKKIFTIALLTSCMGLMASSPLGITHRNETSLGIGAGHIFKRSSTSERTFLKVKESVFSASGKDYDQAEMTSSGLFINLGVFMPNSNYLNPAGLYTDIWGIGYNFELGSFFRFVKIKEGMLGIGLRAVWLDIGYVKGTSDYDEFSSLNGSFLRVGPQLSIGVTETMAADVFYTIGMNYNLEVYQGEEDYRMSSHFLGLTHEIGAAFRYKVFSLGLALRMGNMGNIAVSDNDNDTELEVDNDYVYPMNHMKVSLGFRF